LEIANKLRRGEAIIDTSLDVTTTNGSSTLPLVAKLQSFIWEPFVGRSTTDAAQVALASAICAWTKRYLGTPGDTKEIEGHIDISLERLNFAICAEIPSHLCVFTSHLLAWISYSTCSQELFAHAHFRGSLVILTILCYHQATNPLSPTLLLYGPFILDCASSWTTRNGLVPFRSTTFNQRVQYFDDLRSNDNNNFWHTGILEAANSTLGNLMEVCLTALHNLAKQEAGVDFSHQGLKDQALQYIQAEVGDPDLHAALKAIYNSFQGLQTDHSNIEGQLITRLFHRLRCILLIHNILESPSLQEGMSLPETKYIARTIVNFCRKQTIRRGGPIEDYYLMSWHNYVHLLLGGMALQANQHAECKYPLKQVANCSGRLGY